MHIASDEALFSVIISGVLYVYMKRNRKDDRHGILNNQDAELLAIMFMLFMISTGSIVDLSTLIVSILVSPWR